MTSNFAFHPTVNEVVPFSAQYSFPNQATRQSKRTVKLTPKNNSAIYSSGSVIRFEFPASGYLNPNTTYLAFNANIKKNTGNFVNGGTLNSGFEFQQGIQSIFRRLRVLYGSMVIEDIQDYNILQRIFVETVLPCGSNLGTSAILQGIGPTLRKLTTSSNTFPSPYHNNYTRYNYHSSGVEASPADHGIAVRRYAIPINSGLFQQHNLIPLKFMASQLSIELEIAEAVDCCICIEGTGAGSPAVPTSLTVQVGLPELVTELLEFDSDFDQAIFKVMKTGLPIYFQSWHVTTQNVAPNLTVQLNVQESARSVRYALAVLVDDTNRSLRRDAHHFIAGLAATQVDAVATDAGDTSITSQTAMESYQWRLGGTYYPSQPVSVYAGTIQNTTGVDANYSDPPVEAYSELMKVFGNLFGDDGTFFGDQRFSFFGEVRKGGATPTSGFISTSFVLAGNFMSDRGDVISGINAEEQNDLQLIMKFVGTTAGTTKTAKIVTCFDNLIILGQSNNMVHIN